MAYDLTGDGRTALKFGANRYMRPMAGSFAKRYNPIRGLATDTRDWFDVDLLPGTNTRSGISRPTDRDDIVQDNEIGRSNNLNFGKTSARSAVDGLQREYNVEYTAAVQRQLFNRLSVTAAWYRRQFYDLIAEDNVLLNPQQDWTPFQVANPLGNGEMITVYNLNRAKQGQLEILEYNSDSNTHISNDLELSFNSRLPNGSVVFGGWTASRNVEVTCDQYNPNGLAANDLYFSISFQRGGRFCDERDLDIPFRHDFKIAGTLPLPYGVEFSGTVVSFAGNETQVVWNMPISAFPNGDQRTQATSGSADGSGHAVSGSMEPGGRRDQEELPAVWLSIHGTGGCVQRPQWRECHNRDADVRPQPGLPEHDSSGTAASAGGTGEVVRRITEVDSSQSTVDS